MTKTKPKMLNDITKGIRKQIKLGLLILKSFPPQFVQSYNIM